MPIYENFVMLKRGQENVPIANLSGWQQLNVRRQLDESGLTFAYDLLQGLSLKEVSERVDGVKVNFQVLGEMPRT